MNDYRVLRNKFDELWRAFERYCNERYNEQGVRNRVLRFAQEHSLMLWANQEVQQAAREVAGMECVGDSESARRQGILATSDPFPPSPTVKGATAYLRRSCSVGFEEICHEVCRDRKRELCRSVGLAEQDRSEFEAVMRIVYQIRCNVVHGGKLLRVDREQLERDQRLLRIGITVLKEVLDTIPTL